MRQNAQLDSDPDTESSSTFVLERRDSERIDCSVGIQIYVNGAKVCSAVVKNISKTGAMLLVPSGSWVPSAFHIIGLIDNLPVKVRRIWSEDAMVGVCFVGVELNRGPAAA